MIVNARNESIVNRASAVQKRKARLAEPGHRFFGKNLNFFFTFIIAFLRFELLKIPYDVTVYFLIVGKSSCSATKRSHLSMASLLSSR